MLRFYCWITGDKYSVVSQEDTWSIKKIRILGLAVFLPVITWTIIAYLLFNQLFAMQEADSLYRALVAGIIVFIIESLIVMSRGGLWITVFRIILGLAIALLGALIVDEVWFAEDINRKYVENKELQINKQLAIVEENHMDEIAQLTELVSNTHHQLITAQEDYKNEVDGTGGSKNYGLGPAAKAKLEIVNYRNLEYSQAVDKLDRVEKKLAQEKERVRSQTNASYSDTALLHRIEAMFDLVFESGAMLFFYTIVTVIAFVIEFLVVILKQALRKSLYEKKVDLVEEIGVRQIALIMQRNEILFPPEKNHPGYNSAKQLMKTNKQNTFLF